MTTVYFAGPGTTQMEAARRWDWEKRPLSILVSFAYLDQWKQTGPYYRNPKSLMLDSGAFTAYTTGKVVDHDALLREAAKPVWDEAVGLDVIGDWEGSKRNAEYALARDPVAARKMMPVFHIGDPWDLLTWYCERYPKVGLSCRFGEPVPTSLRFYEQCFARAWPHRFHSFGWVEEKALQAFPFHSADAATWAVAPTAYRNWVFKKRGVQVQKHLSVEGNEMMTHGVRNHMESMYRREQSLKAHWATTLAKLEAPSC